MNKKFQFPLFPLLQILLILKQKYSQMIILLPKKNRAEPTLDFIFAMLNLGC
jgi:hypothetical protein